MPKCEALREAKSRGKSTNAFPGFYYEVVMGMPMILIQERL